MPRLSKSDHAKGRVMRLVRQLLGYANHELETKDMGQLSVRWLDQHSPKPKLVVQSTLRDLADLISLKPSSSKIKDQIRHDLRLLQEFLHILEDNRTKTQGSETWHFTLHLWHSSTAQNVIELERHWKRCKSQTVSSLTHEETEQQTDFTQPENSFPKIPHHNLPTRDYAQFIGREVQIIQLLEWLHPDHPAARIGISGTGGIGKTSLALEIAYSCAFKYRYAEFDTALAIPDFDVIIFISAKQHHLTIRGILPYLRQERSLHQICRSILQTLGDTDLLSADLDDQMQRIQARLACQHVLLIVDNLETVTEEQSVLAFLYNLPSTVKVIVTSCERAVMDISIHIESLSESEGLRFIQHQAQIKAIHLSLENTHQLYQATGGIPAAIVYAIGQLANGYLLPDVLPRLTLAESDFCRFYFERSVQPLRGQPIHQLLMSLALFAKPVSREALIQIVLPNSTAVTEGLARLHQLSLITLQAESYTMLPLTRKYVLAELQANPDFDQEVRVRWIRWYLKFCQKHSYQNWKEWHDYTALDKEWENIQAAIEWCIEQNQYEYFAQFWQNIRGYTHLYGYSSERLSWMQWWIQAAKKRSDTAMLAEAQRDQAWTLALMGKSEYLVEAEQLLEQAWQLRDPANQHFQLELSLERAMLYIRQDQLEVAEYWLQQSKQLLPQVQLATSDQCRYTIRIDYYEAEVWCRQGEYKQAKALYQRVLEAAQTVGWQQVEIYALNWLAEIALNQTEIDQAEVLLHQSLPIVQQQQDKRSIAFHQRSWAQLEQLKGNTSESRRWTETAMKSFADLGMDAEAQEMQSWLEVDAN